MKHIDYVNKAFEGIAGRLREIFRGGVGESGREIYRGPRNTLYDLSVDGEQLCFKHFRKAKFPNNFIYTTFRHSKARRSYEHALRLEQLGFMTPQPVAWGENRRGLELKDSYYVCRYVDLPNLRGWAQRPDADRLVDALGREMLRLHRAGVCHRDFSPGNLLVECVGDGYRFYYVDINRIDFGVTSRARLMTMFRSISLDPDETALLARSYARTAGEDPDRVVAEALAQLRRYQVSKARHRLLKKLLGLSR